jgi:hypothetical protein
MNQATQHTIKEIFNEPRIRAVIIKNINKLIESDKNLILKLPIDKIDGININCNISGHSKIIYFDIDAINVYKEVPREIFSYDEDDYDDTYDDTPEYDIEHINLYHKYLNLPTDGLNLVNQNLILDFVHQIIEDIPKLKLCKITSKFIIKTDDQDEAEFNKAIYESIEDKTNIECTIKECPVCMDLTNNKTFCNHFLCIACWDKMPKKRNDIKCPMCRASIINK